MSQAENQKSLNTVNNYEEIVWEGELRKDPYLTRKKNRKILSATVTTLITNTLLIYFIRFKL